MNKKFTRISALALTGLLGVSALAGCNQPDEKPWGDKIRIDVSLYSGGYGTDWFIDLANEYNASQDKYYINKLPDNKNDIYQISQKIVAGIKEADLFITNSSDIGSLLKSDKLIDLTQVYNTKHEGEDTDVKGKVKDYEIIQKTMGKDGVMYALPYQTGLSGIVYDHDLFKEMRLLFEDNTTENGLTKGKDGVEGTYDDGLPVTYEDFKDLVDEIKTKQMIPFIISDKIETGLTEPVAEAIWAQYDGLTNYQISYNYNGTYKTSAGAEIAITPDTGYKLFSEGLMEGRTKAATFFKEMLLASDNNYNDVTNTSGWSHTDAQGKFLMSHNTGKRVAMIFEGAWWENEAKPSFAADARNNGDQWAYGNRDFRMMPIPSFPGESAESAGKNYFDVGGAGAVFALKQNDAEKEAGIIDFLKAYTKDKNLRNFTKRSGALLPYDYDFTPEDVASFTPFTKNMIEIMSSPSTQLLNTEGYMIAGGMRKPLRWDIRINEQSASSLMATMRKGSVSDYANALKAMYNSTNWSSAIV